MSSEFANCSISSHFGNLLAAAHDWQTLITGFIALLIGGLTIFKLSQQISTEKNKENQRRYRQDFASRATLGLILHELGENLIETLEIVIREQGNRLFSTDLPKLKTVVIDREMIHMLKDVIISTNNDGARSTLANLTNEIQKIQSNIRKLNEKDKGIKFFDIVTDGYDWQITIGKAYVLTQALEPYVQSINFRGPFRAKWSDVTDFLGENGATSKEIKAKLDKLDKDEIYFWTAQ